jgi:CHAT domain-containing protein
LATLNIRLRREFPDYAALTSPLPLAAKEVQGLLGADEALIVWVAGETDTELFALTRETVEWHRLPIGAEALGKKVADFRRGLNVDLVADGKAPKSELFDLASAHQTYKDLMGPIEPILKRKHNLLIVASGALTALPFQALVTEAPASAAASDDMSEYRDAAWIIKQNALTVVPSVASLKSLRIFARKDPAAKPMVGFGDPVFQPGAANPGGGQRSVNAKKKAKAAPKRAAVKTRGYVDFWQGASVDRSLLGEALGQLPDTADEIRDVAKKLGAGPNDIFLGAAATEAAVKSAPLADYKVVYFATHGLVAGDVKGLAEPSLVMTLPRNPTPADDGLLTASEVAQLRMNADWVVLSACNTIAGEKPGAEALSGLARSFFYAGARALLVSHWAVASDAATTLTTTTFASLAADPKLGRAEALRRAMVAYIGDTSRPMNAYPAFWAPFSIVGEGVLR